MRTSLIPFLCAALAAACASSGGTATARRDACPLHPADSVFIGVKPVFRDCAVDRRAKLVTRDIRPEFTPMQQRTACFAADVEFVVDSAGVPEVRTARLVHATDPGWGQAVMATLPKWRYDPAMRDGVPVRQIVAEHQTMMTMVSVQRVAVGGAPTPSVPLSRAQRPPSC